MDANWLIATIMSFNQIKSDIYSSKQTNINDIHRQRRTITIP